MRARASGIADDAVLPEHVLREVARAFPADADDLARIPGTGPLVLAGLADEVLAVPARMRRCASPSSTASAPTPST